MDLLKISLMIINLALHVTHNTNLTTSTGTGNELSSQMKTYYDNNIIRNAKPYLVHDQFGQKRPIPKNKGKIIEFRKLAPLAKATTPLTEGTTPAGLSLDWSVLTATVAQYGSYVTVSDVLQMTAIDNNLHEAGIILGEQAGQTLDTITRDILNAGTNVQYADGKASRYVLVGGDSTYANNDYLTVACIRRAVRTLKRNNAKPINGSFVGIVHPDAAFDLQSDPKWENVRVYCDPKDMYTGEIGRLYGVRFVESTEAKIFSALDLVDTGGANDARTLTVASYSNKVITIDEALSAADATALAGRKINLETYQYTVVSAASGGAGAATITIEEVPTHAPAHEDIIYPGEAAKAGRACYGTLIIGKDAYGVTEIEGGGLENIIKQLGSGGTEDPLNQRATSGWKAIKTAKILVQEYMVRIETACSYQ